MAICDATMLERSCQRPGPSSTTAAAVSSHEVSIPRTSMNDLGSRILNAGFEGFFKRSAIDTALGDDRGDVLRGRDIERGIADVRAFRRELVAADVRDLAGVALLDRNGVTVFGRQVDRRPRRRHVERD